MGNCLGNQNHLSKQSEEFLIAAQEGHHEKVKAVLEGENAVNVDVQDKVK